MDNKRRSSSAAKIFTLALASVITLSGCSFGVNDSEANMNDAEKTFVEETRSLNTSIIRNAPGLNQEGPDNIVKNYTDEELVAEGYRLCESFAIGITLKDIIVGSVDANTQYANTAIGLGAAYHLCPSYKYLADEFVNG
jgi:hypothetical protein